MGIRHGLRKEIMVAIPLMTGWWQLKYFLFSPLFGEMIHFDEHIFQMGWLKPPTREAVSKTVTKTVL